jgi:uncharacterized membrane protein
MVWFILVFVILIYILVFLINYIKKIRIGEAEQDPNDYWKFSYDILDKNEFNKSIKKVRDSDLVYSQKMFKDKLLGYFWFLVIIIFFLFLYIFAGIVQFSMNQ